MFSLLAAEHFDEKAFFFQLGDIFVQDVIFRLKIFRLRAISL